MESFESSDDVKSEGKIVVLGNNHLLQSVGSNNEYLTTCENNDHLSKVKDVSTDNSCSLSQHVDISPAESFRETRIQYLKDINAVVLKKSRHCVDNDFNRTADALLLLNTLTLMPMEYRSAVLLMLSKRNLVSIALGKKACIKKLPILDMHMICCV